MLSVLQDFRESRRGQILEEIWERFLAEFLQKRHQQLPQWLHSNLVSGHSSLVGFSIHDMFGCIWPTLDPCFDQAWSFDMDSNRFLEAHWCMKTPKLYNKLLLPVSAQRAYSTKPTVRTVCCCPSVADISIHLLTTVLRVSNSCAGGWRIGKYPIVVTSCSSWDSVWLNSVQILKVKDKVA